VPFCEGRATDRLSFLFPSRKRRLTDGERGLRLAAASQQTGCAATDSSMPLRRVGLPALFAATLLAATARPADRLILRNLDIVTDRTVASFDEDGIILDRPRPGGGDRVSWDEIERGKVALDQARFDKLLDELGPPLYRIRQRIKIGDYEAAGEPAELLYPRFAERRSQTAYLVCQATMWSRIAAGKREAAVEPYLRSFELLRSKAAVSTALPGSRRLSADPVSAISPELMPVWFDAAAAKAALPGVQQMMRTMAQPRPEGAYVYYATLAIAGGEASEAERVLPLLGSNDETTSAWRDIVLAQQELAADSPEAAIERLRLRRDILPEPCRPVGLFLTGLADIRSSDEETIRDGVLALLTLPAVYAAKQPELAAASLYHAASALDKLKDTSGAAAVRRELTSRYVGTYFGGKSRGQARR
jgi:hypothetical protein